jgi:endonuclease YncB( thermonuclease family)
LPVEVNFGYDRNIRPAEPRALVRVSDGDTPVIDQPVRMVSCDTPEKARYAGRPEISQPKLDSCKQRLQDGFYTDITTDLRDYLLERLTNDAATKHISAGNDATARFEEIVEERLTKENGTKRKTAIIPTGEIIDIHGRLLSYMAPYFTGSTSDPLPPPNDPKRRTFNLQMIEEGWAAFFPIYPSLPKNSDLNIAIASAETAWSDKKGVWEAYGDKILLGYEYRMCIKLGTAQTAQDGMDEAFQRLCVDLRTLEIVGKFGFSEVPPPYRLWIWEKDLEQANVDLDLQLT